MFGQWISQTQQICAIRAIPMQKDHGGTHLSA
jgi:hypothetical protein